MPLVNENFLKLQAGYLFPEIARRVNEHLAAHPDAKLIKLGIGDVTEPLAPAVAEAMKAAVAIPVTVKSRIGIDDRDSYAELVAFTEQVAAAGCDALIVHARKAWLKGLSPRENREVPPLRWDWVRALKRDVPALPMVLNGGVTRLEQVEELLSERRLDGVMIGREAYQNPWLLADVDRRLFGAPNPVSTPQQALAAFLPYVERQLVEGVPLASMTRHLLGLFHACPGAKAWRRTLSEQAHRPGAGIEVLRAAASRVRMPSRASELAEA
ncbi:MAG: tRNA-dihydrouridine synthase [Halochromatium sp.]